MKLSQILVSVLFLGVLGCGTTEPSECDSLLGLEVTSGTAPLFTWSPTCAVHSILVLDAAFWHGVLDVGATKDGVFLALDPPKFVWRRHFTFRNLLPPG